MRQRHDMRGFSIIELMVSLAIGMLILAGLAAVFLNSLSSHREVNSAAQQIENGRYALDTMVNDLHMAGYYGDFYNAPVPASLGDPCTVTATWVTDQSSGLFSTLGHPVQGYAASSYLSGTFSAAPDMSGTDCSSTLTSTVLSTGSDILVIRRGDSGKLVPPAVAVNREVYLQANVKKGQIQLGNGAAISATSTADGSALSITKKDATSAADIRKLHVHVYYVDRSERVPTLKRLELKSVNNATTMDVVPIAEGIEAFTVEYGLDTSPSTVSSVTGFKGDGVVDSTTRTPSVADLENVVAVTIRVLARNPDPTQGYVDDKTYNMGAIGTYGPRNDQFKRHLYTAMVRLVNPASRREEP